MKKLNIEMVMSQVVCGLQCLTINNICYLTPYYSKVCGSQISSIHITGS